MKRHYGHNNGRHENPGRCIVEVYAADGRGFISGQCRYFAKFGELCGIHERQRIRGQSTLFIPTPKPCDARCKPRTVQP